MTKLVTERLDLRLVQFRSRDCDAPCIGLVVVTTFASCGRRRRRDESARCHSRKRCRRTFGAIGGFLPRSLPRTRSASTLIASRLEADFPVGGYGYRWLLTRWAATPGDRVIATNDRKHRGRGRARFIVLERSSADRGNVKRCIK